MHSPLTKIGIIAFIGIVLFIVACNTKRNAISFPSYFPQENRVLFDTVSDAAIVLGSKLFFDKRLSRDSTVACANCHKPELAFTDGLSISRGLPGHFSRHNSSTLLNVGFSPTFMFDMRAINLDIQPMIPIHDTNEMAMTMPELCIRFNEDKALQDLSDKAYHRKIDAYVITHSLSSFMKSLISSTSKYDKSITLNKSNLLTDNESKGRDIFFEKGACNSCHTAPLFTNHLHYNLGIESNGSIRIGKLGATHREEDRFRFKTPTLRNIEITAPYFHNGQVNTLEKAVSYHLAKERATKDYSPPKLNLDEQRDLVLFLRTLTDESYIK